MEGWTPPLTVAAGDKPGQWVTGFGATLKWASGSSTTRNLVNVPIKFQNMAYFQGDNHKRYGTTTIAVDVPVTVYAVVDPQHSIAAVPDGFAATGETLQFSNNGALNTFDVYSRAYEAGAVRITFTGGAAGTVAAIANFFVQRRCQGMHSDGHSGCVHSLSRPLTRKGGGGGRRRSRP